MTPERLAQIRARLMAATPGPWSVNQPMPSMFRVWSDDRHIALATGSFEPNIRFMAHAFTDIGDLLVAFADSREEANDLDQRLRLAEAVVEAARNTRVARCPGALHDGLAAYDTTDNDSVPALVIIDGTTARDPHDCACLADDGASPVHDATPKEMLEELGREFTAELGQLPPWEDDEPEGLPLTERLRMYALWAQKRMTGGTKNHEGACSPVCPCRDFIG